MYAAGIALPDRAYVSKFYKIVYAYNTELICDNRFIVIHNVAQLSISRRIFISCESVQKWEQGKSKPRGSALRLLNIIEQKGIAAVI